MESESPINLIPPVYNEHGKVDGRIVLEHDPTAPESKIY